MLKYVFLVLILYTNIVSSQIKFKKSKFSIPLKTTIVSSISQDDLEIKILKTLNTDIGSVSYEIVFKCKEYKCVKDSRSAVKKLMENQEYKVYFKDVDNDYINLKNIITEGFLDTPYSPVRLEVPFGLMVLTYDKDQYGTKVRIGFRPKISREIFQDGKEEYLPEHYSGWMTLSQIKYLFK